MLEFLIIALVLCVMAGIVAGTVYMCVTRVQVENTKVKLAQESKEKQLAENHWSLEMKRMELLHEQKMKTLELTGGTSEELKDALPIGSTTTFETKQRQAYKYKDPSRF